MVSSRLDVRHRIVSAPPKELQLNSDPLSNHFVAFEAIPRLWNDLKAGDDVEEQYFDDLESVLVDDLHHLSPFQLVETWDDIAETGPPNSTGAVNVNTE